MHYKKSHFLLLRYSHFKYLTHAIKDYNLNYTPARPRIDQLYHLTLPMQLTKILKNRSQRSYACLLLTYKKPNSPG